MVVSAHPEGVHYRAFLSYSHRDATFAARLHRRLEAYVLPGRLGANRRLSPIFKDREELSAARDLSDQVRAALAASDCLIVACSPAAAASPWVTREIETFRTLHPGRPILAALIQGEPTEAFPAVLYEGGVEPLAADFRKDGDGDRLAFLKLVAGIAGVGVDQLIQRDAQRRLRGVMAVTAAALVAVVAMGGMTFVALEARAEAERQRAEAEGIVKFMLTDLRASLKSVGRLSIMDAANRRALRYYDGQKTSDLPRSSQLMKAVLLRAIGEDDLARGDPVRARTSFAAAFSITKVVVSAAPRDREAVWGHAQSYYWSGYAHFLDGEFPSARRDWEAYLAHAIRLADIAPDDRRAVEELAYARGAICTLNVSSTVNIDGTIGLCRRALENMQSAQRRHPSPALTFDVATRWAWLAESQAVGGRAAAALASREQQYQLLKELLASDPKNTEYLASLGANRRALSRAFFVSGNYDKSRAAAEEMRGIYRDLVISDPRNQRWREQFAFSQQVISRIQNR